MFMQKSFHVNKTYSYLVPFLNEQPNISRYLCELVAKDYSNQLKTMEMTDLAQLVSSELETHLTSQLEIKMEKAITKCLENLVLEIIKKPIQQDYLQSYLIESLLKGSTQKNPRLDKGFE